MSFVLNIGCLCRFSSNGSREGIMIAVCWSIQHLSIYNKSPPPVDVGLPRNTSTAPRQELHYGKAFVHTELNVSAVSAGKTPSTIHTPVFRCE